MLKRVGILLSGLILVLTLLAPAEKQLGSIAKLIYLHGALIQVSLILLGLTTLFALLSLFRRKYYPLARSSLKVTTVFLTANVLLVPIITKLTWGIFIAWQEPRVITTFFLFALTVAVLLITDASDNLVLNSLLCVLPGLALILLGLNMGRVLHPVNPIGSSESLAIKACSLGIYLSALSLGIFWIWYWQKQEV
ncbi:MAG TPA: hypothetical protein GX711_09785 [Clostridia bacterium]|nr:hypothetical protein [Clostridia bacterium]